MSPENSLTPSKRNRKPNSLLKDYHTTMNPNTSNLTPVGKSPQLPENKVLDESDRSEDSEDSKNQENNSKKRKLRDTNLEGFTYTCTEDFVEIWQKEVLKGVFAKRGKCAYPLISPDGETTLCGKIFQKVPHCKRHVKTHQKKINHTIEFSKPFESLFDKQEEHSLSNHSNSSSEKLTTKTDFVQCELCKKWRRIPHEQIKSIPEYWTCDMNLDINYDSCDIPQEMDDWKIDKELGLEVVFIDNKVEDLSPLSEQDLWMHDIEKDLTQTNFDRLYESIFQ